MILEDFIVMNLSLGMFSLQSVYKHFNKVACIDF